jgi:hypothetical protein
VATDVVSLGLTDHRPDWERHYYAGSSDPAQFQRGVTFLAAENFAPAPFDQIPQIVAEQVQRLPDPPVSAEVHLKSFRVVVNRTAALQAEHVRQRTMTHRERLAERQRRFDEHQECRRQHRLAVQEAKREGRPPPASPCSAPQSDYHVGVGVSSDAVGTGAGGLIGVGVVGIALLSQDLLKTERLLEGPPAELPSSYGPGITCEITASVVLHWADGRQAEIEVAAAMFSESQRTTDPGGRIITAVVQAALDEVGAQVAAHFAEPPDSGPENSATTAEAPAGE